MIAAARTNYPVNTATIAQVVLTLTRKIKSEVTGQAPITQEWKTTTPGKKLLVSGLLCYDSSIRVFALK